MEKSIGVAMKLQEAIDAGLPLAVRIDGDNDRIMAEAFVVPGGVSFVDVYWRLSLGTTPFHMLRGTVTGDGPWRVGSAEIRVIDHGDPRASEWNRWRAYRQSDEGQLSTRQAAWLDMQDLED